MTDPRLSALEPETKTSEPPAVPDHFRDMDKEDGWGSVSIPLQHPFAFRGVACDKLVVRIPNGGDMLRYLSEQKRPAHLLLSIVSDAPPELLEAMHAADFLTCINALARVMNGETEE